MVGTRFPTPPAVNPARAGMIPASSSAMAATVSKPRASGDDPPHGSATLIVPW